jgi:hypothetical protein
MGNRDQRGRLGPFTRVSQENYVAAWASPCHDNVRVDEVVALSIRIIMHRLTSPQFDRQLVSLFKRIGGQKSVQSVFAGVLMEGAVPMLG